LLASQPARNEEPTMLPAAMNIHDFEVFIVTP
jgi:hypothetical protein